MYIYVCLYSNQAFKSGCVIAWCQHFTVMLCPHRFFHLLPDLTSFLCRHDTYLYDRFRAFKGKWRISNRHTCFFLLFRKSNKLIYYILLVSCWVTFMLCFPPGEQWSFMSDFFIWKARWWWVTHILSPRRPEFTSANVTDNCNQVFLVSVSW